MKKRHYKVRSLLATNPRFVHEQEFIFFKKCSCTGKRFFLTKADIYYQSPYEALILPVKESLLFPFFKYILGHRVRLL